MTNPTHLIHLDQIGEDAAKALRKGQASVRAAQEKLRQIWAAYDEAKKNKVPVLINGCKNKKEWAAHFKITMRYCQYVVRDGSRKNQRKANSVRVVKVREGDIFVLNGRRFRMLDEGDIADHPMSGTTTTYKITLLGNEVVNTEPETKSAAVLPISAIEAQPVATETETTKAGNALPARETGAEAAKPPARAAKAKMLHAAKDGNISLCGKLLFHKTTAFDGEEVTCKACLMQQGMDEIRRPQDVADVLPDCSTETQGEQQ